VDARPAARAAAAGGWTGAWTTHTGPAGRYDSLRYEAEILAFVVDAADAAG
jgi:hypothetical protein